MQQKNKSENNENNVKLCNIYILIKKMKKS
jgi:hypothetical protein